MKKFALLVLFATCLFSVLVFNQNTAVAQTQSTLAQSAPAFTPAYTPNYLSHPTCPHKRIISRFINEQQVEAQGFHFQVTPPGGSYAFNQEGPRRYLSLRMDPFPFNGELSSSRITEIDTSLPPEDRIFCWQPTQTKNVFVQYTHRFTEAAPPPGLIENLFLWNAPLDSGSLITAVGVTRNNLIGGYFAIVAQDYDFATGTGLLQLMPMPAWLDATAWHTVNVTISQETATIKVKQGGVEATILQTALLHPPDPLGFEFSMDNEIFPGVIVPVTIADQIDVAFYGAGLQHK